MMLHDEILNFEFNVNPLIYKKRNMNVSYMVYKNLLEDKNSIAPFYFNHNDFGNNEELYETALSFLADGFLNLPFDENLFVVKDHDVSGDDVALFCFKMTDLYKKNLIDFQKSLGFSSARVKIENALIGFFPVIRFKEPMKYFGYVAPGDTVGFIFKDKNDNNGKNILAGISWDTSKEVELTLTANGYAIIQAMMLMNTKYVEKIDCVIPEKLNKSRARRGKPILRDYSIIKINQKYLERSQDGESHASPKPHWRRGHIRTLQDGRKIPVQPCLVNFDGKDILPNKGVYVL